MTTQDTITLENTDLLIMCEALEEMTASLINGAISSNLDGVLTERSEFDRQTNAMFWLNENYGMLQGVITLTKIIAAATGDYLSAQVFPIPDKREREREREKLTATTTAAGTAGAAQQHLSLSELNPLTAATQSA